MIYGINYMGSKNSIAPDLVLFMAQRHQDKKYFIDAFCGGLAVSHVAILNTGLNIIANDYNKYMVSLYNHLMMDTLTFDAKAWVDRDVYLDVRDNPQKYSEDYVAFVLSTWSFGGGMSGYIYGKEIIETKKSLFNAVINDKWDKDMTIFRDSALPKYINLNDLPFSANKRKLILKRYNECYNTKMHLQNLSNLERVLDVKKALMLNRSRVQFSSKDYMAFILSLPKEILANAIIYLDPPYERTKGYYRGSLEYPTFWRFVAHLRDVCPVYVSSYNCEETLGIEVVWEQNKRVLMDDSNAKRATEKLFYNGYCK